MNGPKMREPWYLAGASTLLCALALSGAAIWNGYPIVYSDTSSYIISGFELETLKDRPITYGLFIRVSSFNGWSLWTVVIAQSMLLAYVIGRSLKSIGSTNSMMRAAVIILVSLLSGLPFVSGQIITDVFTPILLFTLYLLFFTSGDRRERALLFALFLMSFAMHMSHIGITALLLAGLLVLRHTVRRTVPFAARWRTFGSVVLLAVIGSLAMGPSLAKSKHTFFAARMADAGILQRYLDEHCGEENFVLCARKGSIPQDANAFLWDKNSPLNLYKDHHEQEEELAHIARSSFAEPALLRMHMKAAGVSIGRQFIRFNVGDGNGAFGEGTALHERITRFIPSEVQQFDAARQMDDARFWAPLVNANHLYNVVMVIALLALLAQLAIGLRGSHIQGITPLVVFLLAGLVVNVCVNAGLVMTADRFGTKTAWLIPYCALVLALRQQLTSRRKSNEPAP